MTLYTFKSVTGRKVSVSAPSEELGRRAAMRELWGPPREWCVNNGTGLDLLAVKDEDTSSEAHS